MADKARTSSLEEEENNGAAGATTTQSQRRQTPKKNKKNKYITLASSFFACLLLGYAIGVMSGPVHYLSQEIEMTDVQKEVAIGILSIYSFIGSTAAGITSDWLGRRYTVVIAGALFFVGGLLSIATNYAFLMVSRFVAGIAVGFASVIAPVYTAEVAPASSRGFLASFPDVFINLGILLGLVSNYGFTKIPEHLRWRFKLGIGGFLSIYMAITVLAMPESPCWLVMKGRLGDAIRVLNRTSDSPEEAINRLSSLKEAAGIPEHCNDDVVSVPKRNNGDSVWRELLIHPTPSVRHILICVVGIHFFQQASGIDALALYSPDIWAEAGLKSDTDRLLSWVVTGLTKTVFIFVATFQLDKIGRRALLLSSVAGMIVSSVGLGIGLTANENSERSLAWASALTVSGAVSYMAFFSIGLGPITGVYTSEIFPFRLRAQGFSIGVAVNRLTSGVLSMSFISLHSSITFGGAFFLYGGVEVVAWVFFYTLYPETLGKTLEETEGLFGTFFKWRTTLKELDDNKGRRSNGDSSNNQC